MIKRLEECILLIAAMTLTVLVLAGCGGGEGGSSSANGGSTNTGAIQLPQSGQTVSYASGDDGNLQKGVAWPTPRFIDIGDGTMADTLTGLIWAKDVSISGKKT